MARKQPKERYIPKGYKVIRQRQAVKAVVYGKGLAAIGYYGNCKKHDFYYQFLNKDSMKSYIDDWFKTCKMRCEDEERHRKEMAKPNSFQEGDILYNSWGWEQTNIDFYLVVGRTDKTIKIRQIEAERKESAPLAMSGTTMPVKVDGEYRFASEEVLTKKVVKGDGCNFKYGWGSKWDGQPMGCSWYA